MMKVVFCLLACSLSVFAEESLDRVMLRDGLPCKLSIAVCSDVGTPVEGACATFVFANLNQRNPQIVTGTTDKAGIAVAEALANNEIVIHINKEGFYETVLTHSVWKAGGSNYATGKWEPWNPMVEAVLYRKKHPRKSDLRIQTTYHLSKEGVYGFDLFTNQIVEPGSNGGHADFLFSGAGSYYKHDMRFDGDWEKHDIFTFNLSGDGFIAMKKNKQSKFKFVYEAPLVGYENPVEFFASKVEPYKDKPYPVHGTDFLVFRVSRTNSETGEIELFYGVIEAMRYAREWDSGEPFFTIDYRLNPTPGDRNIEYN